MSNMLGMEVLVSEYAMVKGEPVTVRRSWRERLLSWPWRPWVSTSTYTPMVPGCYQFEGKLLMHPRYLHELKLITEVTPIGRKRA